MEASRDCKHFRDSGKVFSSRKEGLCDWLAERQPSGAFPTPSFEGLLGEAMSIRARSLGFGDILPLAEGGGRCESQLLRSPYSREEAGVTTLGGEDAWSPLWACIAIAGPLRGDKCERWVQRPDSGALAEGRYPWAFKPIPCFLTKAKRALGRK